MSKLMCSIANVRQVEMLFSDGRGGTDNMKPIPRETHHCDAAPD